MREWVLIATRRAEMSLRTPDVVEFCHEPQPAPCGRGSETQCADTEPRPKGAVCVTPTKLAQVDFPRHHTIAATTSRVRRPISARRVEMSLDPAA